MVILDVVDKYGEVRKCVYAGDLWVECFVGLKAIYVGISWSILYAQITIRITTVVKIKYM